MTGIPQRRLGGVLEVGALGLGCMGMSGFYQPADQSEAMATILHAIDRGATVLDTSDAYGPHTNEQLIGTTVRRRRDEVVIATKFGLAPGEGYGGYVINGRPDYVRRACDASLKRLGVEHIDLYYQHRLDRQVPIEDTVGAMSELVAAGKVRHLGLCEAGPETLRRAHAVHPIAALQTEWSLWSRDIEDRVLPVARELGISIVPYSPLGRGFFTGQITSTDDLAPDDLRRGMPRFQPDNLATNLHLAGQVKLVAARHGCTPAQLALAWVLSRGPDVMPIPGTTRRAHLDDNLAATRLSLTGADIAQLDALRDAVVGQRANPATTHMEQ